MNELLLSWLKARAINIKAQIIDKTHQGIFTATCNTDVLRISQCAMTMRSTINHTLIMARWVLQYVRFNIVIISDL